ncbi:MAG: ComEA family DNA-binding protein [Acidiferrobacterales bacterium]
MKLFHAIFVSFFIVFASLTAHADPVDINTANAMVISKTLKGIGIKKAQAIVAYREKNGKFKTVEDLVKVKGIGKKTVAMNKENLTVGKMKK